MCWDLDSNQGSLAARVLQTRVLVHSTIPAKLFNIVYQFKTDLKFKRIFLGLRLNIMPEEGKFLIS